MKRLQHIALVGGKVLVSEESFRPVREWLIPVFAVVVGSPMIDGDNCLNALVSSFLTSVAGVVSNTTYPFRDEMSADRHTTAGSNPW